MTVVTRWNGSSFMHRCQQPLGAPPEIRQRVAPEATGVIQLKSVAPDKMPQDLSSAPPARVSLPASQLSETHVVYEHEQASSRPADSAPSATPRAPAPAGVLDTTGARVPAKALYRYSAMNPDEMSLQEGDDVWLRMGSTDVEPGWVLAEKANGNRCVCVCARARACVCARARVRACVRVHGWVGAG